MKLLIYLTLFLFSLGELGRISFLNQQINGYLYELLMFISLVYLVFKFRFKPISLAFKRFKIIFYFLAVLLLSYFLSYFQFSPIQNGVAFLYFLRLVFYLTYFAYLGYSAKKLNLRKILYNGVILVSILTLISSVLQYLYYPDLRNLWYLGWDPHYYRMFGVFFDTSIASAIFGLLFWFAAFSLNYILAPLYIILIVLTFSRSLYLAFFSSLIFYFWQNKNLKIVISLIVLFLLFFLIAPKQFGQGVGLTRLFSIESRLVDYREGINLWLKNPILGAGYNHLRYVRNAVDALHSGASLSSSFLIILVDAGMIGLILFISSLIKFAKLNRFTALVIIFISIMSLTDNIILHPFVLFLMGTLLLFFSTAPADR